MSSVLTNTDSAQPEDGSDGDFRGLLAAARPALLAFAQRIHPAEADDLCQETLARALRYSHSFDPGRALLPWLRASLMRAAVDLSRRRLQRAREFAHEEDPPAPETGADEYNAQRVAALLATLDPLDARLLRGFHLDGRSIAELAQSTGLAEGSVRSRLHRARRRLAAAPRTTMDPK